MIKRCQSQWGELNSIWRIKTAGEQGEQGEREREKERERDDTHVTEIPPPSSLPPAVGLKLTVWSSAVKTHSILTVLSVSWKYFNNLEKNKQKCFTCMITGFAWMTTWLTYRPRPCIDEVLRYLWDIVNNSHHLQTELSRTEFLWESSDWSQSDLSPARNKLEDYQWRTPVHWTPGKKTNQGKIFYYLFCFLLEIDIDRIELWPI